MKYKITGTTLKGKRFSIESSNFAYINMINAYKGSIWEILENGKKKLLKRISC